MGNPTFYYYPEGGALQTVEITSSSGVARLRDSLGSKGAQRQTLAGRVVTAVRSRDWVVEIEVRPTRQDAAPAILEKLRDMMDHAQRGGLVGFAEDGDAAWLSYMVAPPAPGSSVIITSGCVGYVPTAAMAVGTRVRLEYYDRALKREDHVIGTAVSNGDTLVTLARSTRMGLGITGWVRQDGYHPALRLILGEEPEDNDRRQLYSFRFRFRADVQALVDETVWQQVYTGSSPFAAIVGNPDDLLDTSLDDLGVID